MQIDRPISIAIILFIIFLLIFFLVAPEYRTLAQLQSDLSEKRAEYFSQYDYYASIDKIYLDLQSRQSELNKVDDALPQNPDLGRLIYFLQETARQNGLVIKSVFLSKSSPVKTNSKSASNVKDIIFSADLLGDYPSLEGFIKSLQKSDRIFEVTSISFGSESMPTIGASQSQFQIQQSYSFNLQIKTHSY